MKRLLSMALALIVLGCISPMAQAVPRPSWDWASIEALPRPDDPETVENKLRADNSVLVELDAQEAFIRFSSYATFWTPMTARVWVFRYADNNLLTEDQIAAEWAEQKASLSKFLEFQLYLTASEYEYGTLAGIGSKINNVILIDDKGRRFSAVDKQSMDPKFDTSGANISVKVNSAVKFPLIGPDGKPIITNETKYVDLFLTTNVGKAKFHFAFED